MFDRSKLLETVKKLAEISEHIHDGVMHENAFLDVKLGRTQI